MIVAYKCPACQNAFNLEAKLTQWSVKGNEERSELAFTVVVAEKLRLSHAKILCSTDCYTLYREARVKANEAYDAIMGKFEDGGFDA